MSQYDLSHTIRFRIHHSVISSARNASKMLLFILLPVTAAVASAQQLQDLQQQLQQLKLEYQQKLQDLEKRLSNLEKQKSQATTSAQALQQQSQSQNVASSMNNGIEQGVKAAIVNGSSQMPSVQGQLPSAPVYDLLQEAQSEISKLQEQAKTFEFHGYFRSGYGLNGARGQQVAFDAPGAGAKFRLGNEAETYGELIFVNNWTNPAHDLAQPWIKTEVMVEANTSNAENYANPNTDQFRFREAFVQIGNVFKSQPDAKFWAGQRYYRRQHIDIDDFYPLDMSGYGGGVEDLNVGFGKAAIALLGGAIPQVVTNHGTYSKGNIDARLYDIKAPLGKVGFWFDYATAKGGTYQTSVCAVQTCNAQQAADNALQNVTIPTSTGYAFGFTHQRLEWKGGYHQFGIQFGKGAASNFSSSLDNPTPYLNRSSRFLLTEQLVIQPNKRFAIMPIALYQRYKDGIPLHGTDRWLSFGARPVVFFTDHVSLAVEGGFDRVWSGQHLYDGWLRKFTIAPQIGSGREFFSRPVLRLFLTFGNWSDGLMGYVGGIPYQNKTNGLTYGIQAETWW